MPTEQEIKQAALKVAPKGRKKLQAKNLGAEADVAKVLVQGPTGSGKTRLLAEVLQTKDPATGRHPRIYVASTDIGGNGLRSVKDRLLAVQRADLLANIEYTDFQDYETFAGFLAGTLVPEISTGVDLWEWAPDVIVQDGFSNFQESHVWRYILDLEPLAKDSIEIRDAGVYAGQQEWGQIRKATTLCVDGFLRLNNPRTGAVPHKIVTVLMDDGKEDKITHENKRGPLVLGAARSYIQAAFDMILTTRAISKPGAKGPEYSYQCEVGGPSVAKFRGNESRRLPVEALKGADFRTIWEFLTQPPAAVAVPVEGGV